MSSGPREYLRHILAEVDYLLQESEGLDKDAFLESQTLRRAFVRALEIVGEATKQLPRSIRQRHPQIEEVLRDESDDDSDRFPSP